MNRCILSWSVALSILTVAACGEAETAMQSTGNPESRTDRDRITLGGGCFWCIEAVFEELRGVETAESGYAGGHTPNPTYKQVCTGDTGHAEVVQVTFDPQVISLEKILEVFFTVHDPTTRDRQGPDVGTQYRSAAYYEHDAQKRVIEETIATFEERGLYTGEIVTEVAALDRFWPAEDYHQEYFELNGQQPYCRAVIAPKISKFRKEFKEWLKP
jgi:peptide-methionine (S)-S-oxide reductase